MNWCTSPRALVVWYPGPLVLGFFGPLVLSFAGPLVLWSNGPFLFACCIAFSGASLSYCTLPYKIEKAVQREEEHFVQQ